MSRNIYLERYAWKDPLFTKFHSDYDLELIIVLPAFKEVQLLTALESLNECENPIGGVLIIVLINESEEDMEARAINEVCFQSLKSYTSKYNLIFSHQKLPPKKAGVGLARKIGMDEAVRIFEKLNKDGIIVCYDADCTCQTNYLIEIEKSFAKPKTKAGVIFYEHQLHGPNHEAIINYERYLRYYIDSLRYANYPYAHQTLGSCIVVRSSTYQSQGGMNIRKAGEDFYFLNKVIPLGGFVEINSTTIYPSDRVSDRVPFGTGKAIEQMLNSKGEYTVYHPKCFEDLKVFFTQIGNMRNDTNIEIPDSISRFFDGNIEKELGKIRKQTSSLSTFILRFFRLFDAFRILKFVHFARDNYYPNLPLKEALVWLETVCTGPLPRDPKENLIELRSHDRKGLNQIK